MVRWKKPMPSDPMPKRLQPTSKSSIGILKAPSPPLRQRFNRSWLPLLVPGVSTLQGHFHYSNLTQSARVECKQLLPRPVSLFISTCQGVLIWFFKVHNPYVDHIKCNRRSYDCHMCCLHVLTTCSSTSALCCLLTVVPHTDSSTSTHSTISRSP